MKILLTGARSPATLDLARQLRRAGHEILAADTSRNVVCRYSRAVSKMFSVPSPRFKTLEFVRAVADIVKEHQVDLLIPNWEETLYLSKGLNWFPESCRIFCSPFETIKRLHNKFLFMQELETQGFRIPKSVVIESPEELEELRFDVPYALKACYSRASEQVYKLQPGDPKPAIEPTPDHPWVAQEWIEGKCFCTYNVVREGVLKAHVTYPVQFAEEGKFCVTFESVAHDGILDWVRRFVATQGYNGQISFDFIQAADGTLFAIECNPRITSGIHLFSDELGIAPAMLGDPDVPVIPPPGRKRQIFTGMLMYGWRTARSWKDVVTYLKRLFFVRDVVWRFDDIKPTLFAPLIFGGYWRASLRHKVSIPAAFTYDVDWNGELDSIHF
jgi:ATP-grasp domain